MSEQSAIFFSSLYNKLLLLSFLRQRIIYILLQIAELLGLTVYTEKSKVLVFRNGGH